MKKFFRIEERYKFEYDDLRAFFTVLNVVLIMSFGVSVAYIGLGIALIGILKDFTGSRRINSFIIHIANSILYFYFIVNGGRL